MKTFLSSALRIAPMCLFLLAAAVVGAQRDSAGSAILPSSPQGLFDREEPLAIRLTGNIRALMNDRGDNPELRPLILSYKTENGNDISLSIQAKTRGHFRKTMGGCTYPPLLLQFSKSDTLSSSIFSQQHKLKLVVPCRGDEYVIREWLVYKIYNLVTPQSFRTRLVTIELDDTKKNKTTPPFYGLLLEEEQQMAKRNHDVLFKRQVRPENSNLCIFKNGRVSIFDWQYGLVSAISEY